MVCSSGMVSSQDFEIIVMLHMIVWTRCLKGKTSVHERCMGLICDNSEMAEGNHIHLFLFYLIYLMKSLSRVQFHFVGSEIKKQFFLSDSSIN